VAHAAAIKRALGEDTCVTVDVNQAWDEVTATRGMAALEAAGIDLVEQPISRRHRRGMARLAARFAVPIMADESLAGPEDAFELASDAAADVFSLKISKAGGPLATLRTAAVAGAAGIALYGGTMLEGSVGTIASAHTFAACAHLSWGTELFGPLLLRDDVVVERPTYRDCALEVPRRPGLGIDLDLDKLAFYRRDRPRTTVSMLAQA
jgi:muconate cycloisomerase